MCREFPKIAFISTTGALVVITVQEVSSITHPVHHPLHFLLSRTSAHSNCVLTFPSNIYRHTCYNLRIFWDSIKKNENNAGVKHLINSLSKSERFCTLKPVKVCPTIKFVTCLCHFQFSWIDLLI